MFACTERSLRVLEVQHVRRRYDHRIQVLRQQLAVVLGSVSEAKMVAHLRQLCYAQSAHADQLHVVAGGGSSTMDAGPRADDIIPETGEEGAIVDQRDAAESAGLVYVSDEEPGIRRRKSGKGFTYRNPDGSTTVTALELYVQALGKSQTIDVSSATCAGRTGAEGGGDEAPRPHPVPSDLPVTG